MNAVVVVPWRPGDPERERNYARVRAFWDALDYPVFVADSGHEYFTAGASRNQAAAEAGAWEVAIFTDADMLPGEPRQIPDAIEAAHESGAFTVGYSRLHWLDAAGTEKVCSGTPPEKVKPLRSAAKTWVNTCAIRRDLFELIGGFDEGFVGYGMEDLAFYKAAATFAGTRRVEGPLYHLWHPERPEEERLYANWNREVRYNRAFGDKEAMLEVIANR